MKHYEVVAAVVRHNNRYLCLQKGKTRYDYTSFKFEFPGGKIEPGESPEHALQRELREEMDYDVNVIDQITTVNYAYPDFCITLTAYLCVPYSHDFTLNEHIAFEWKSKDELRTLDWAAADLGIVDKIAPQSSL